MQMQLYDEEGDGLSFEDFKELLSAMLTKVAKSSVEKKSFEKNLREIFDLFDENSKWSLLISCKFVREWERWL